MDGETVLILLIIAAAVVALVAFLMKKEHKTKPPSSPVITTTIRTSSPGSKTTPGAVPIRYPQNVPQPDPVIPIFEDRIIRQVRRCPSCDGENPIHAQICEICGRNL